MLRSLATLVIATIVAGTGSPAMALEEPQFEVIHITDDYEIRRYAPYIVAEVDVAGDMGDSGNRAFRILANYIFGNNEPGQKMQMTAPVVSDAPRASKDAFTYAFVMESRYSMNTLPAPVDPRIRIVQKPAQVVAARSYSGRWTQENFLRHELSLVSALTIDGLSMRSEPLLARYNSPFRPWFLRRNEVLVELDWSQD